jgi:hypothetical protein
MTLRFNLMGAALVTAAVMGIGTTAPARAQESVPKLGVICPLGYVDTFNGRCSSLGMKYTVFPKGNADCPKGSMDVGGGYCRKI